MKRDVCLFLLSLIGCLQALAGIGDKFVVTVPFDGQSQTTIGIPFEVTSESPREVKVVSGISSNVVGILTIPETIENNGVTYTVTELDVSALRAEGSSEIAQFTGVNLPKTIRTIIGKYAFRYLGHLSSVVLPDNVTRLEEWTFAGCSELVSVKLPANLTYIGQSCFWNCWKICSSLSAVPRIGPSR